MGLGARRGLTQQEPRASRETPFSVPALRLWAALNPPPPPQEEAEEARPPACTSAAPGVGARWL